MAKPNASAEVAPLPPNVPSAIQRALASWAGQHLLAAPTAATPVAIALSGGADSVALLVTAHSAWSGAVVALHVNHGLQAAAPHFQVVCQSVCEALRIPLLCSDVAVDRAAGTSLEAEARAVRYVALAQLASGCSALAVLLGQHADDQAETVLLALTRGAGMPGLAAMGASSIKHGVRFGRPFLGLRAGVLRQWAQRSGLLFVDDPSNLDQRHTRNRIRHSVLPVLQRHFPAAVDTLGRTARHAAEAAGLLNELAVSDLAMLGSPPPIKGLRALSRPRLANVLRHWLQACAGHAPSTAQLDELVSQVARCTTRGHHISIRVSAGRVHRSLGVLQYTPDDQGSLFF